MCMLLLSLSLSVLAFSFYAYIPLSLSWSLSLDLDLDLDLYSVYVGRFRTPILSLCYPILFWFMCRTSVWMVACLCLSACLLVCLSGWLSAWLAGLLSGWLFLFMNLLGSDREPPVQFQQYELLVVHSRGCHLAPVPMHGIRFCC